MNKKTLAYFNDAVRAGNRDYINLHINEIDLNQEDKNGLTPLLSAMVAEKWDVAERILEAGAEVDYVSKINGFNALHHASGNGNIDFIKTLFIHKRDLKLDVKNKKGYTALHLACLKGHLNTAVFLAVAGAKIEIRNDKGFNALGLAILNERKEVVEWLRNLGLKE